MNWTRLRRDGRERLTVWSTESKAMISCIDAIAERLPEFEDAPAFLAFLDSYTAHLPVYLQDEIKRLVMTSLFGATVEEE